MTVSRFQEMADHLGVVTAPYFDPDPGLDSVVVAVAAGDSAASLGQVLADQFRLHLVSALHCSQHDAVGFSVSHHYYSRRLVLGSGSFRSDYSALRPQNLRDRYSGPSGHLRLAKVSAAASSSVPSCWDQG